MLVLYFLCETVSWPFGLLLNLYGWAWRCGPSDVKHVHACCLSLQALKESPTPPKPNRACPAVKMTVEAMNVGHLRDIPGWACPGRWCVRNCGHDAQGGRNEGTEGILVGCFGRSARPPGLRKCPSQIWLLEKLWVDVPRPQDIWTSCFSNLSETIGGPGYIDPRTNNFWWHWADDLWAWEDALFDEAGEKHDIS